jgi:type II secretory pathway pseudopilin PulG
MRMIARRMRSMEGFTLIETLAALLVFSVVTIGVVPLIGATLRSSVLSRTMTVSKNLTVEAMERARGLPYHIKQAAQPGNVDLLDFYHPAPPNAGVFFRTTCASGATNPACPRNIPAGTTVVFEARFVTTTGVTVATPTTYNARTAGADTPPSLLAELTIRTTATVRGRQRSFELRSLLADRKFSGLKVSGISRVAYAIQVLTSYETSTIERNLIASVGENESRIETRRESYGNQVVRAAP